MTPELRTLERVARNNRGDATAQHDYGIALVQHGRYAQAVEVLTRAASVCPADRRWPILHNLGAAYRGGGDVEAAYAATEQALALNPTFAPSLFHLADTNLGWGRVSEAVRWYRKAIAADPNHSGAWLGLIFALDLVPGVTAEQAKAERLAYARQFEGPVRASWRPHPNDPDPERTLRIGFASADFRDHTAAYMVGPIYEHIDRDRFEVYSYANISHEDAISRWFMSRSDGWRNTCDQSAAVTAQQVRLDRIDVLIDPAGYTNGGPLPICVHKPAPVQLSAWGYLTGTGLEAVDGVIADAVLVPPEHERHFRERVVRVPYALGFAPIRVDVPIRPRPPGRPLTFGHLGRSEKAEGSLDLWARVLRASPGSRMVLKDRGFSQRRTAEHVTAGCAARGVDPERLLIGGTTDRTAHLETYNEVDVILDSVPQGGGTTTIEAAYMGTPVVSLLGERIIGRIAATTLSQLGHADWVVRSEDEYVKRAAELIGQGGPGLRERLLGSVVCDGAARTRAFERVVREAWGMWCQRPS